MPQPTSPHLALWCRTLGALSLYADRTETRRLMEAGKPVALLAYLALSPNHKASRDHVAELFWSGCELPQARHSLRQSLYRLREAAGVELVRAHGMELELLPALDVDCVNAEELAVNGDRPRAYELLRGNFLEGFAIPESQEFESWAEATRVRFREVKAEVARELAERHLSASEPDRALEIAEGLAGLHPFSPITIHLVMRALAALDRPAAAVARFHSYADLLQRELGDTPPAQVSRYAQELAEYLRTLPEPSTAALPFVGRERQWAVLERVLESVQRSNGATILIEGAAGLGKTRLLRELQRRVQVTGTVVLAARCYEVERAVPYGAIAQALSVAADRPEFAAIPPPWLAEAARLLPELRERFSGIPDAHGSGGSPGSKRRLHEALVRCFGAVAVGAPVLLTVDDIQWADAPTLEVLHLLSRRLRETTTLIVASYRPAELTPAPRQFARALCGDRSAELLVLDPIEVADVTRLLAELGSFADQVMADALAAELHRHTSGNTLFLSELLSTLERRRLLYAHDGSWHVAPEVRGAELPRTLGKLLADRVDGLAPWVRACLETVAVAGQETSVELLAQVLQVSEPKAQLALSVLEEERLLKRSGVDLFEPIHDELRRLVYHGISDERRRLLHAAVGVALEQRGVVKSAGGAARLAYHFDQAGDREHAHRYALAAAGEAEALAAPGEQRAHLDVAEAHAPKALPPVKRVEARGLWGFIRRHGLVAAGAAGVALSSATVGYLYAPALGGGAAYRQGTIYLARGNVSGPTDRLVWPSRRDRLARVQTLPVVGSPPLLVVKAVTDQHETHAKVFAVRGTDTVQLTYGLSDDAGPTWFPDGRHFLMLRGWKSSATRFQQDILLMDSTGGVVRAITNTLWQDGNLSLSPAATRITFLRVSSGGPTIWIADADGGNAEDVTKRFGLPRALGYAAFGPGDDRLAILYADTGSGLGAMYVVDLGRATVTTVRAMPASQAQLPLWSPDGQWLAYTTLRGDSSVLWVAPVDGSSGPVRIAKFASMLLPHAWTGGRRRWAARVVLEPEQLALGIGHGVRARASAQTSDRDTVSTILRWSVGDSSIAAVDELGFVRGRGVGTTRLVASAGGLRSDTALVTVTGVRAETLLVENWSEGLDTARWTRFGFPQPRVVHDASLGRSVFFNNGDYNHGSGAVSVPRFTVDDAGLTLDIDGWLQTTGQHWQNWQAGFMAEVLPRNVSEAGAGAASLNFSGPEPTLPFSRWTCGSAPVSGPATPGLRWTNVSIAIRPDGWCECWLDGRRVSAAPLPDGYARRPLAVVLRGMSVGTRIYHGSLVVTRGLKY